jgi:hypothetical protein
MFCGSVPETVSPPGCGLPAGPQAQTRYAGPSGRRPPQGRLGAPWARDFPALCASVQIHTWAAAPATTPLTTTPTSAEMASSGGRPIVAPSKSTTASHIGHSVGRDVTPRVGQAPERLLLAILGVAAIEPDGKPVELGMVEQEVLPEVRPERLLVVRPLIAVVLQEYELGKTQAIVSHAFGSLGSQQNRLNLLPPYGVVLTRL